MNIKVYWKKKFYTASDNFVFISFIKNRFVLEYFFLGTQYDHNIIIIGWNSISFYILYITFIGESDRIFFPRMFYQYISICICHKFELVLKMLFIHSSHLYLFVWNTLHYIFGVGCNFTWFNKHNIHSISTRLICMIWWIISIRRFFSIKRKPKIKLLKNGKERMSTMLGFSWI